MLRQVASDVLPEFKRRIHIEGLDADGNKIGTYSASYMAVRTGNYKSKKPKKEGSVRTKYNRTSDTKVILSLTRQMESDLSVTETQRGYGFGYKNKHNYDKALWCENTYNKKILTRLTKEEKEKAKLVAEDFIIEFLKEK